MGSFLEATLQAMRASRPRAAPDPATLPLLDLPLPPDLQALLQAWTFHSAPVGALRAWDVYERWRFSFSVAPVEPAEVDRICKLLGGPGRPPSPPGFYVRIGSDAGGVEFFATVKDGATSVFGPERGEDFGDLESFLFQVYEWSDLEPDPALAAVDPELFADAPQTDDDGVV